MMIPFSLIQQAHDAGLCIVPPAQDGTKKPYPPGGGGWKSYQTQRPTLAVLQRWYDPRNGLTGAGVICGKVSGNLEAIDFDTRDAWIEYRQYAEMCGIEPLLSRILAGYGEESPRGAHLLYRCATIAGNTKLALTEDGKKATIETRGEGGYIIIAPSNGKVHPSGGDYRATSGSLATIVEISPLERRDLWELAKSLTKFTPPAMASNPFVSSADPSNRPGEDFNRRANWPEVLEPHGWRRVAQRGDKTYWRRPDKSEGISATTGYAGTDYLYVFSTSTSFESERGYTKFSAFAVLNCAGDFREATKALAALGYGEPLRKAERPLNPPIQLVPPSPQPQAEATDEPERKEFLSLAEFISGPPKASYLIKGVIPGVGIGQVFGSSNVGKSFLLIDIAMHIACGMAWCGFRTKKSAVLYVAGEGLAGLSGRMKAWTQRYGEIPENFWVRPFPVGLTVAGAAIAMADRLASLPYRPQLIVLDTLAANFGPGSENDAEDMALALGGLRSLGGDWMVLCVHHSGHQDKERSRGHSSLFAALDVELRVSRDDSQGQIKLEHTKVRDGERLKTPLFFALEPEFLPWADEDGEPINSAVLIPCAGLDTVKEGGRRLAVKGAKQVKALNLLRDLYAQHRQNLGGGGMPRVALREWYGAMDFELDRSHRNRLKRDLEEAGLIVVEHDFVYLSEDSF